MAGERHDPSAVLGMTEERGNPVSLHPLLEGEGGKKRISVLSGREGKLLVEKRLPQSNIEKETLR